MHNSTTRVQNIGKPNRRKTSKKKKKYPKATKHQPKKSQPKTFLDILKLTLSIIFNSISVNALIVLFVTIGALSGIIIYLSIESSTRSIHIRQVEREQSFTSVTRDINEVLTGIETASLQLVGLTDHIANLEYGDGLTGANDEELAQILMQYFRRFSEHSFKTTDYIAGLWLYENNTDITTAGIENDEFFRGHPAGPGKSLYKYYTVPNEFPLPEDAKVTRIEGKNTTLEMLSSIEFYSEIHCMWDYWYGEMSGGFYPYLSFSYTRKIYNIPDVNGNPRNISANWWFGMTTKATSQWLTEKTPALSESWFIELGRNFLLGVSNAPNLDALGKNGNIISPADYEHSAVVRDISKMIMESNDIINDLRSKGKGVTTFLVHDGYDVLVQYSNSSRFFGEWVFVNAKLRLEVFKDVIISIILSVLIIASILILILVGWGYIILRLVMEFNRIIQEISLVEEMKLDEIRLKEGLKYTFFELRILVNKLLFMIKQLKKFRSFLPRNILEKFNNVQSSTKTNSSVYSASSKSSSKNSLLTVGSDVSNLNPSSDKFKLGLFNQEVTIVKVFYSLISNEENSLEDFYQRLFDINDKFGGISQVYDFTTTYVRFLFPNVPITSIAPINLAKKIICDDWTDYLKDIHVVIGRGSVKMGNLGCEGYKKFIIQGKLVNEIDDLSGRCPFYVKICVNEKLSQVMNGSFAHEIRRIDNKSPKLYELGNSIKIKSNEWMYEMQEREELKTWGMFNEAVLLYEHKEYEKSVKMLQKFLKTFPEDMVGMSWVKMVEDEKKMTKK